MELNEFKKEKQKLEKEIMDTVYNLLHDFHVKTKQYPYAVDLNILEITNMSDVERQYILYSCEVLINV